MRNGARGPGAVTGLLSTGLVAVVLATSLLLVTPDLAGAADTDQVPTTGDAVRQPTTATDTARQPTTAADPARQPTTAADPARHPIGTADHGEPPTWRDVAVGDWHTCAVRTDGSLWCWGNGVSGQLGDGDTVDRPLGVRVEVTPGAAYAGAGWVAVTAGAFHTCGVRADGSLWCWGRNDSGQLGDGTTASRPAPTRVGAVGEPGAAYAGAGWVAVTAGAFHTCGVRTDGSLWCWGRNDSGQLGDGTTASRPAPTRVGAVGEPVNAYAGSGWATVTAAGASTCATGTDGSLWCWGRDDSGSLGAGTDVWPTVPTRVGAGETPSTVSAGPGEGETPATVSTGREATWATVSAGEHGACALRVDGGLWCWGRDRPVAAGGGPAPLEPGAAWTAVDVGYEYACAIRVGGDLWCWGGGNTRLPASRTPGRVMEGSAWTDVTVGTGHACALRADGALRCWGANDDGQLGGGRDLTVPVPTRVGSGSGAGSAGEPAWETVSAGGHACALRAAGGLWCWGEDYHGQLGIDSSLPRDTPTQVPGSWVAAAAGAMHTCAVRADTTAWCWGANDSGQLGNGNADPEDGSTPVAVAELSRVTAVAAGTQHSCAILADRTLWCWGLDSEGQLGDGAFGWVRPAPLRVAGDGEWAAVSARGSHTCGVRTDGSLWCWGRNDAGQLGDGTTTPRARPTQVLPGPTLPGSTLLGSTWSSVSSGVFHTCGVRTDGSLWCWGRNDAGQLGDGTTAERVLPVRVGSDGDWATVSADGFHTCGVRTDGSLWCWGRNGSGELGDGTTTGRLTPVRPVGGGTWRSVSAGGEGSFAVGVDGTLWAWGDNRDGRLGLPASPSVVVVGARA